ncbi:putative lipid-transfer protein DIR1 [Rosa chinensis]|uniref:putative lipid-transfer protein DIR1 n=1 Tax=Rosa chinensis TaxID=74649 RepID=UPI000D097CE4|nr:putative lipid-transfer protein DIR1 [Rosa chinensis]
MKYLIVIMLAVLVTVGNLWGFDVGIDGAGECGSNPEVVVYKLAPCGPAAQDGSFAVSPKCCSLVKRVDKRCLCAIVLSKELQSRVLNPVIAVTIPKRCKDPRHLKGYKCGAYIVP